MEAVLETLRQSPRLPDYVREMQALLETERQARERFYEEVREDQKAEFINGEIVMHSPARDRHLETRDNLAELLRTHVRVFHLGTVRGEKALCVFPRNDYEPDVVFFGPEKSALIQPNTRKFPIPDFAAEVLSESTERTDRREKFQDFEAHGVLEYWIVDADRGVIEQYLVEDGRYVLTLKSGSGEIESPTVSGFRIPIAAIFDAELHLATLRRILSVPSAHP